MLFVEALQSPAEVETVAETFHDIPLVFNASEARPPEFTLDQLGGMGFAVVLAPITTLLSATKAMQESLTDLHELGFRSDRLATMTSYDDFLHLVGIDEIDEQERRYS